MSIEGIYRGLEYETLRRGEDILHSGIEWFAVVKAYPCSGEASFPAADQKVWSQPCSGEAGFAAVDQKACLKNISLCSGKASFSATDQKVWALCLFPPPLRFIKILKIIKVRMPRNKMFFM